MAKEISKKQQKQKSKYEGLIVKYNNDLNLLTFPKLSLNQKKMVQLILAMTREEHEEKYEKLNFLSRFFNKNTRTIEIEFAKFYKLINGNDWKISAREIGDIIDDMLEKLLRSILSYEDESRIMKFVCFEKAEYVKHEQIVRIKLQKDFYNMITSYEKGFTVLDYFEYCSLNSIYSQNLYPILRQFRNKGEVTLFEEKWKQFASIMQFPENITTANVDKLLEQVKKELSSPKTVLNNDNHIPFENLDYTKVKGSGRGRGGSVVGIIWKFKPHKEKKEKKIPSVETKENAKPKPTIESLNNENQMQKIDSIVKNSIKSVDSAIGNQKDKNNEIKNIAYEWDLVLKNYLGAYVYNNGDMVKIEVARTYYLGERPSVSVSLKNPDTNKAYFYPTNFSSLEHFKNWYEKNKV